MKTSENIKSSDEYKKAVVEIRSRKLNVEVADSQAKLTKGLSGRNMLDKDSGMLFVIDPPSVKTFWMKGMLIDLDIIWIKDEKIIYISKDVPKPEENTPDYKLPMYSPQKPVDYVLEVNAGLSSEYGFETGNEVNIKF